MNGRMSDTDTSKSQAVKWIEPAKQEKIPDKVTGSCGEKTIDKVTEPYEIIIGNNSDIYGFSKTMTLKFETLAELKTAITVLADIVIGFGETGAALMITKPDVEERLSNEDSK